MWTSAKTKKCNNSFQCVVGGRPFTPLDLISVLTQHGDETARWRFRYSNFDFHGWFLLLDMIRRFQDWFRSVLRLFAWYQV